MISTGVSTYIEGSENNCWSAVHVEDLADLYAKALESKVSGELFHASAESGIRTGDIAHAISMAVGLKGDITAVSIEAASEWLGPMAGYWASNSQSSGDKVKNILNWQPSGPRLLDDILRGSYRT